MAQTIYKLYLFKPTQAWYQLTEDEKNTQRAKTREALSTVGGKELLSCFSGWNSEQLLGWGVEEFPDIAAVQKHHSLLMAMNWFRYADSISYLGTEIPAP